MVLTPEIAPLPQRRRSPRKISRLQAVVWLAIAVSSALRIWAITRSFFWQDDYIHIWRAWNQPAATFLTQDWNGHVEPLSWGFYWVITRLAPQVWWPAAVYLSVIAVAMPVAWWWLVRSLAGVNRTSVAITVVFAFWPGLLVPQVWLATGLEVTSVLFAILTVAAVVAWRGQRRQYAALAFLLIGFLFNERALYAVPLVVLTLLMFSQATGLRQRWRAIRDDHRGVLAALVAEGLLLVGAFWVLGRDSADDGRFVLAEFFRGLWMGGPEGVLKSLLGLDAFWPDLRVTTPPAPPLWVTGLVIAVTIVLLVIGWRRDRRQTLFCTGSVLAVYLVEVLLVASLRTEFLGIGLIRDPRYTFAAGMLVLLSILSFRDRVPHPQEPSRRRRALAVSLVALIAVSGSISMVRIASILDSGPAKQWFETARAAFIGPDAAPLVSTPSPPPMLGGFFIGRTDQGYPVDLGTTRTLLQVGDSQPRFAESSILPVAAGLTGGISPVDLFPVSSTSPAGFGGDCSVTVGAGNDQWVTIPMSPVQLTNPAIVLDYLAVAPTTLEVSAGDWRTATSVPRGFRSLWVFPPPGPIDSVRVRAVGEAKRVCLGSVKAGSPQAVTTP